MTEPTASSTYTGAEVCPKCSSADLTASYNKPDDTLELTCRKCNHRWPVRPLDTPPE